MAKKAETLTCQLIVERNDKGEVRRCGNVIERHELPQDPYWRQPHLLRCTEHLRAYTPPTMPSD